MINRVSQLWTSPKKVVLCEREIKELTEGVCLNYVAFWTKTDLKKRWNLFSITGGSETGKTRLVITTLQLVRNELEKNRQQYVTLISTNLKKPMNAELGTEIFDLLLGSIRIDDDLPNTLYIDLSNGDYIQDCKEHGESLFLLSGMQDLLPLYQSKHHQSKDQGRRVPQAIHPRNSGDSHTPTPQTRT